LYNWNQTFIIKLNSTTNKYSQVKHIYLSIRKYLNLFLNNL
jgi:hypothetical protein